MVFGAMRAIWKGAIAFGLVNVPVKLYSATEDHDVRLHQVHDNDGGRIRYQRKCEMCGKVVDYEHIDKAYDEDRPTVVLTEEDLKSLPAERSREIEVVEFVPSDQLDPIMFDRSYYLEPDSKSPQGVRAAPADSRGDRPDGDRAVLAAPEDPAGRAAGPRDKVLMLQSLLWDDEVREADFAALESLKVSPQELKMSASLVDNMATDFAREVQRRVPGAAPPADRGQAGAGRQAGHGGDLRRGGEKADDAEVIDLMEALRQSVERNRAARKTPAKKSTAEKSTGPRRRRPRRPPPKRPGEEGGEEGQLAPNRANRFTV